MNNPLTIILVLGGMHFFNMFNFSRMRKKALAQPLPPVFAKTVGHPGNI